MNKSLSFVIFLVIVTLSFQPAFASEAQEDDAVRFVPGQLVVKLRPERSLDDIAGINSRYNVFACELLFNQAPDAEARLKELKNKLSLLNSGVAWYWQLFKDPNQYKVYLTKVENEKRELQAQIRGWEELIVLLRTRKSRAAEEQDSVLNNLYVLRVDQATDVLNMAKDYNGHYAVEYAQPNCIAKTEATAEIKPLNLSGITLTGASQRGALPIILAEIDTGINYSYSAFSRQVWVNSREIANNGIDDDGNGFVDDIVGWNFIDNNNLPMDQYGHGSYVAYQAIKVLLETGIDAPVKMMMVKSLGPGATDVEVARSIQYAVDNGAAVINASFIGANMVVEDALNDAYAKGCIIVAGAGNNNKDVKDYSPARLPSVIAVSACEENGLKNPISNWGDKCELSAAAEATSFASPQVAACAALIIFRHPELKTEVIRQILKVTSDDLRETTQDKYFGFGRLNIKRATELDIHIVINSLKYNARVGGRISITGDAWGKDFKKYELKFAPKDSPDNTIRIQSSTEQVQNGLLGIWETDGQTSDGWKPSPDGEYIFILEVTVSADKVIILAVPVVVDNS